MENRIIKFRACDTQINLFHYWQSDMDVHNDIFWTVVRNEKLPVSEFTGLLDRHGKEIYEGDILTYGKGFGNVRWLQEMCRFVVFERESSKYFNLEGDLQLKNSTVVGNIYETEKDE